MSSSIVFIDSRVSDREALLAALPGDATYFLVRPDQDGLEQVASVLSGYSGLSSIRIISHGSPGGLLLGATSVDSAALSSHTSLLAQIGSSLTENGDILLYGCNVAEGEIGSQFINILARHTGADVAASTNPTGSISLDGDWQLEASTGSIEAPGLQVAAYSHLLASPTGAVSIAGVVTQGQTLTASNTIADTDGLGTITYQWQSSSDAGTTWNNASTGTTLSLTEPLVGTLIQVVASYTDAGGTAESVTSTATAAVANLNDSPTGSVTVSGTATQGQVLTASNTLADADGLGIISYLWQSYDGTNWSTLGQTSTNLTLTQAMVGKTIRVVASYTDGHGSAETSTSSATGTVANVDDDPTGSVSITGTVSITQTLTASNTLADADGLGTITYQWQSSPDNSAWSNLSTGSTLGLSSAQTGKYIRVVASYTDNQGSSESVASSATSAVTGINTLPTGSVTISGTVTQGQTLTASNTIADVDGLGTITYTWQTSPTGAATWSNLSTGSTLTLAEAQVGKDIRVVANYTDGGSTAESVPSSATSAVANINDALSGSVTITGTATQGQTLTASNTLADADSLGAISYQWYSSSDNITWNALAGSTASTLALAEAQVGKYVRVTASYTDGHGTAESANSSATSVVANINDALSGSVTIAGTVTQGQTLTASDTLADADTLGAITYTWQTSTDGSTWSTLSTGSTLTLAEAQVGKYVRVNAGYTDGHGTAESASSSATAAVANLNDALSGSVTVTGTAMQGQTLTASNTLADADGLGTISYQWYTSSDGGTTWSALAGSTASTLTLAALQVGKLIRVTANYTDGHGTAESANSSATTAVLIPNASPTGSVTISGTVTQNQTLTASNTVADADGLGVITYTWQSSSDASTWSTVSTGKTLSLTESLVGLYIRTVAGYTDGQGIAQTVASSATAVVANVNDALTGSVTIAGTVSLYQTLTASDTLADADTLGAITYLWQSSSDGTTWSDVSTGSTLGLSEEQFGKYIRVKASYTDGHGTAESAYSSATTTKVTNANNSPTGSVTVTGTATQGQTLTASNTLADADTLGTITYTWQTSTNGTTWTSLTTTGTTLVLAEAQVGKYIRVLAGYTDGYGTAESVASTSTTAVANLNDNPTGSVVFTGNASKGQTLTATNTLADADGLSTITYTWQTSSDGTAWSDLSTGSTLGISDAQVGLKIRVVASYTDGHGASESAASSSTSTISSNVAHSGGVTISGSAILGQILKASNTLADTDGLGEIVYEWQSSSGSTWGSIDTGSSLTLTSDLVGKQIRVIANYTDGLGKDESATSTATSAVSKSSTGSFVGTSGNDVVNFGGSNDKIDAGAGNDTIDAGDGKNKIAAGAGNDQVTSGGGNDKIDAGSGDDTITAGAGKDSITLGLGADIFVFDNIATGGADTLTYFNASEDKFAFESDIFTALAGGITVSNLVIEKGAVAHDDSDYLLFNTKTKKLYYDADGNGSDYDPVLLATVKVLISGVSLSNFTLL